MWWISKPVESIMEYFIDNVLPTQKSNGKVIAGRTRDEAFFAEYNGLPRISEGTRLQSHEHGIQKLEQLVQMASKRAKLNDYYWAAWMEARKGHKNLLRRSMSSIKSVGFDAQTDEYLASGTLGMWNVPHWQRPTSTNRFSQTFLAIKP